MSSRKNSPNAIERQVKRLLGRQNFDLLKPIKPSAKTLERGGFKVRDAATGKILFGEKSYEFSATLEDIEAWLETYEYPRDAGD